MNLKAVMQALAFLLMMPAAQAQSCLVSATTHVCEAVAVQRAALVPYFPGISTKVMPPANFPVVASPGLRVTDLAHPALTLYGSASSAATDGHAGVLYVAKSVRYDGAAGGTPAILGQTFAYDGVASVEVGVSGGINNYATKSSQGDGKGTAGMLGTTGTANCLVAGCVDQWAMVAASYDYSGQRNPPHALYGLQVDNYAKGPDDNHQRIGAQIACGTPDGSTSDPNVCTYGLLMSADGSTGRFTYMITGGTTRAATGLDMTTMHIAGNAIQTPGYLVDHEGSSRGRSFAATAPVGFRETLTTPTSSHAPCAPGEFTDDANYHYVCVAKNTWRRAALSPF